MHGFFLRQGAIALFVSSCMGAAANMKVTSFDGKVTSEELQSFNQYISDLVPAQDNIANNWAQGRSGEQTKAMGLVYQIAGERSVLDNMLRFCDAVLSERNDLAPAPVGQHKIWTGDIAPVWPNDNSSDPIGTGGEQGDPVGHLANCGSLILQTKSLYNEKVTIGDKFKYGATYLARAKTYIREADFAMTKHILPRLLDTSRDNKMYFANDSPYKGGMAVPWNQQMMFTYAFQNLVEAHTILGDNATLVATYRKIMTANIKWFFSGGGSQTKKSKQGNPIYVWTYAPDTTTLEDSNHGSLDVAGFYRAYITGNWSITADQMKPFANVLVDLMTLGGGKYGGSIDGSCGDKHSACTNYIRSGYLFLAQFRPEQYKAIMGADLKEGGTTVAPDIFSRFLWIKHQRSQSL